MSDIGLQSHDKLRHVGHGANWSIRRVFAYYVCDRGPEWRSIARTSLITSRSRRTGLESRHLVANHRAADTNPGGGTDKKSKEVRKENSSSEANSPSER